MWQNICILLGHPQRGGLYRSAHHSVKATVENPRGSVEKLSLKESVEDADTVLRGSMRTPKGVKFEVLTLYYSTV